MTMMLNALQRDAKAKQRERADAARAAIEEVYGHGVSDAEWAEMEATLITFFGLLDTWATEDDIAAQAAEFQRLSDSKIE